MKRSSVLFALIIVTASCAFSQGVGDRIDRHYEVIRDFHPRTEGSNGESRTLEYVASVADELDLAVEQEDFSALEGNHSFSRIAQIEAPGDRPGQVVLAVPLNHPYDRHPQEDGSIALAAGLALLESMAAVTERPTVSLALLGGDVGERRLGTRLFLQGAEQEQPFSVVYLDLTSPGSYISVELGSGGLGTPRAPAQTAIRALLASDLPRRVAPTSLQVARSPLDAPSVLMEYLDRGIPAVRVHDAFARSVHDGGSTGNSTEAWNRELGAFLERLVSDTEAPAEDRWDRHYVYATFGDTSVFVGELLYLIVLLAVLASPVIYGLAFRRRLYRYARLVGSHAWAIAVLLALMFFFFFVATALVQGIFEYRDFPDLWRFAPGQYFLLKLLISIFLFAVMFHSLRGVPFPRNGSFYSAAAIFLLFGDVVILALFDIAYTYYFLWGFLAAFFFSVARRPWSKALGLLAAPVWLVIAGIEIFYIGEYEAVEALLLSPVVGNLIFAVVLLPFLLMLIRLDLLLHRRLQFPHGTTLRATIIASAAAAVIFASYLIFLDPYSENNPQPVAAIEVIDRVNDAHRLELHSPAPLEGLVVRRGFARYRFSAEDGRSARVDLPGRPRPLRIESEREEFLARSRRTVRFDSDLPLHTVRPALQGEEEVLLFDSAYPFQMNETATVVRFAVGTFPPNPFALDFTVPREASLRLDARITSPETGTPIESDVPGFRLISRTRILESVRP
ncbi:MAG: hypothetical protein ACLFUM_02190 [Spirochaetaceae bacterium]